MFSSSDLDGNATPAALPGLQLLQDETPGDPQICVAILDGPVDQSHPCFAGANLTRLQTMVSDAAGSGHMSGHGTHIASTIFGQPGSPVTGIAPGCRGLIVPVFSDEQRGPLSQLNLSRAINQAVEAGANVINISGGQLSQSPDAEQMLTNAVRFCNDNNVLIVAAAGNDGCACLHVPAAMPSVLAVGAMNAQGLPFDFSNWGEPYQKQGILVPGEDILGAAPGGGTVRRTGTSFATPLVSGIAALLLSIQLKRGEEPDPQAIRDAILKSALPCNPEIGLDCRRFLAGSLNIPEAYALIQPGGNKNVSDQQVVAEMLQPSEASTAGQTIATSTLEGEMTPSNLAAPSGQAVLPNPSTQSDVQAVAANPSPLSGIQAAAPAAAPAVQLTTPRPATATAVQPNAVQPNAIQPSNVAPSMCDCGPSGARQLVYAIGVLG